MLEKLERLGNAAKRFVIYLVVPIALVIGFIYGLIMQNRALRQKNAEDELDAAIAARNERLKALRGEADAREKDYRDLADNDSKRDGGGTP